MSRRRRSRTAERRGIQTRDGSNPSKSRIQRRLLWFRRLVAVFSSIISELHARLGFGVSRVRSVSDGASSRSIDLQEAQHSAHLIFSAKLSETSIDQSQECALFSYSWPSACSPSWPGQLRLSMPRRLRLPRPPHQSLSRPTPRPPRCHPKPLELPRLLPNRCLQPRPGPRLRLEQRRPKFQVLRSTTTSRPTQATPSLPLCFPSTSNT